MRNLLIVFLGILFFASCSILKKKPKRPDTISPGRWMEVKRTRLDSSNVSFTDTVHIEFLAKSGYIYYKSSGYIYKDTYTFAAPVINFKIFSLRIKLKKYGKLVLESQDSLIHFLAPDPSPSPFSGKTIKNGLVVEKYAPVTSIDQMVGHWSEYKRTTKTGVTSADYASILKTVDITGGSSDGKLGYLYGTLDGNTASWAITAFANQLLECDGASKRSFNVIKCEKNELIMEENGITYFFRQFR